MNRQQRRAGAGAVPLKWLSREALASIAVRLDQADQPGAAALVRETMQGDLVLLTVSGRAFSPAKGFDTTNPSTILMVGDDDYASTGPTGWRSSGRVARWAACAVIHAAAASADTYLEAAHAARETGRCALIETVPKHAAAWAELFMGKPALVILPRGGVHPIEKGTRH